MIVDPVQRRRIATRAVLFQSLQGNCIQIATQLASGLSGLTGIRALTNGTSIAIVQTTGTTSFTVVLAIAPVAMVGAAQPAATLDLWPLSGKYCGFYFLVGTYYCRICSLDGRRRQAN